MIKKVFIAGGTGFIGIRVCRLLFERGYRVYALTRATSNRGPLAPFVRDFFTGDLADPSDVNGLRHAIIAERIPQIISLVGAVDYHADFATLRQQNVDTARTLVGIAHGLQRSGMLDRLVFAGSVASRGFFDKPPRPHEAITEETDRYVSGISPYADAKRDAEALIRTAATEGLPAIIAQPGSLLGAPIGMTSTTNITLIKKIIAGMPVLAGGASYTSVIRAAEGIILALERGVPGKTYLLGGENMTMADFARLVRRIAARQGHRSRWPLITLPRMASAISGRCNLLINRQQAVLGNGFHYIDSDRARHELGYIHSIDDCIREIGEIIRAVTR